MKPRKSEEDYKTIAWAINSLRKENEGKTFSCREIEELLKGIMPVNTAAKSRLIDCDIIIRVGRGRYAFPGSPIIWTKIRTFYEEQRQKQREYKNPEDYLYGQPIHKVISDMKALGYWVFKKM